MPQLRKQRATPLFDASSGLLWSESTVRASASMNETFRKPRRGAVSDDHDTELTGSLSLEELAIRSFLVNTDEVGVDTLAGLPERVGKRLWRRVEQL